MLAHVHNKGGVQAWTHCPPKADRSTLGGTECSRGPVGEAILHTRGNRCAHVHLRDVAHARNASPLELPIVPTPSVGSLPARRVSRTPRIRGPSGEQYFSRSRGLYASRACNPVPVSRRTLLCRGGAVLSEVVIERGPRRASCARRASTARRRARFPRFLRGPRRLSVFRGRKMARLENARMTSTSRVRDGPPAAQDGRF